MLFKICLTHTERKREYVNERYQKGAMKEERAEGAFALCEPKHENWG